MPLLPHSHMKRLEKLNTTEVLWIYVLKILSKGPSHGYILRRQIKDQFGFIPGNVTAYKVLYDLQRLGLVRKHREGMKRVYEITDKGRKDLKRASKFYSDLSRRLLK